MDNDTQLFLTTADNGDLLALVRMTEDEYQKYSKGQWVTPAPDDRTVYDRSIWEIRPDSVGAAARLVDKMANVSDAKGILLGS